MQDTQNTNRTVQMANISATTLSKSNLASLNKASLEKLAAYISTAKISRVILSDNSFEENTRNLDNIANLIEAIINIPSVEFLSLRNCDLQIFGLARTKKWCSMISKSNIQTLILNNSSNNYDEDWGEPRDYDVFEEKDNIEMITTLLSSASIKHLYIANAMCELPETIDGWSKVFKAIIENTSLESLDISTTLLLSSMQHISNKFIDMLAKCIKQSSLKKLYLSDDLLAGDSRHTDKALQLQTAKLIKVAKNKPGFEIYGIHKEIQKRLLGLLTPKPTLLSHMQKTVEIKQTTAETTTKAAYQKNTT